MKGTTMDTIALANEMELAEMEYYELHETMYVGPFCYLWDNPNLTKEQRDDMILF